MFLMAIHPTEVAEELLLYRMILNFPPPIGWADAKTDWGMLVKGVTATAITPPRPLSTS